VDELAADVVRFYGGSGYIFQDRIAQHPEIARFCGNTVGTARIVTLREADGTRPLYAVWKMARPKAVADNFWRSGNLLAALDVATGEVTRVQMGVGINAEEVTEHPDTGETLTGTRLPLWDRLCEQVVRAARITPEIRIIGWDVAITERGAVLIEGNTSPHHALYQMAHRRGVMNADFAPRFERIIAENEAEVAARLKALAEARRAQRAQVREATRRSADFSKVIQRREMPGSGADSSGNS